MKKTFGLLRFTLLLCLINCWKRKKTIRNQTYIENPVNECVEMIIIIHTFIQQSIYDSLGIFEHFYSRI